MKILVVEDEKPLLELYKKILVSHDYEVETAEDGAVALEKAEEFKPDFIFLDVLLPTLMGDDIIKILRAKPAFKKTPIVVLTGTKLNMEECFKLGATGYMNKAGVTTQKILDCVRMYSMLT